MALVLVGEEPILSFTEDNKPALFINQHYDNCRQYVLRQHPWGSATRRTTLSASADSPDWGFSKAFPVPTDFLRLIERKNFKTEYRLEDDVLLSNNSTEPISYVYDLIDVSKMDPLLQQAIAAFLAAELSIPIAQNGDLRRTNIAVYKDKLAEAQHADVVEAPNEVVSANDWVDARFRGTDQVGADVTVP